MKITRIQDIVITPENIVARLVEYEDGSGELQTFFRPHKKWVTGGLDAGSFVIAPTANEEYLKQADYTDEEIELVFRGFKGADLD